MERLRAGVCVTPTTSTFELLARRLPDLRLSPPDQELEFDPNVSFRGPEELWAEWTPVEVPTATDG